MLGAVLALTAMALAGYIALEEVRKLQHRAHRDEFIADLGKLAAVFEEYRGKNDAWPAGTHAELRMPRGMESVLASTPWLTGHPFGGAYDWIPPQAPPPRAAPPPPDPNAPAQLATAAVKPPPAKPPRDGMIVVTAFSPGSPLTLTEEDMRAIDRALDDGNLATGRFRAGFNGWPTYLVRARP